LEIIYNTVFTSNIGRITTRNTLYPLLKQTDIEGV